MEVGLKEEAGRGRNGARVSFFEIDGKHIMNMSFDNIRESYLIFIIIRHKIDTGSFYLQEGIHLKKRRPIILAVLLAMLVHSSHPAAAAAGPALPGTQGSWDGVTEKATLEGAYIDPLQQEIPFGIRSFFTVPWRSYMDTWDSSRYLDTVGVVFNNVKQEEAAATAAVMGEAGITAARLEIGWSNLDYNDESKLKSVNREAFRAQLTALKNNRIRPLILLNMNSGMPSPNVDVKTTVTQKAAKGDRVLYVDKTADIKPFYTGLKGMGPAMFPVITQVDPATGKCTLSAPLPNDVPQGAITLVKLKYQPFSGPVFKDGTPNPASQETLNGWLRYIKTVAEIVREDLGTTGQADAGFDFEVYNEYTFGYHYMYMDNYYEPKRGFAQEMTYSKGGKTVTGIEVLLPITADFVADPANGLPGVRVISGFSNQRPYDNGTSVWPNQAGYSRHYYTGFDPVKSLIYPGSASSYTASNKLYYNALGRLDGARMPTNINESIPGSYYVPNHVMTMPEEWSYLYTTESLIRDLSPFPGPWQDHFRYASPGNGQTAELWMTETNYYRLPFAQKLINETGATAADPELSNVMLQTGAKALSRLYTFYAHKGMQTITAYNIRNQDNCFGILPEEFFTELKKNNYQLNDAVRAKIGPQMAVLKNIANLMKTGQSISTARPLQVTRLTEYKPQLVFAGDGTAEHPSRYNRDDFAVLPYQLSDRKFAIAYYVMTRDITHTYDESKSPLDPARYSMPEQEYEITLANVAGKGARVSAYDPMTNQSVPAQLLRSDANSVVVKVKSADYPRFLILEEAEQGPLIGAPILSKTADGANLGFFSNVSGVVEVTYGEYPARTMGSVTETVYGDVKFGKQTGQRTLDSMGSLKPFGIGSWTWTGTIVPKYSERYTFTAHSDNLNETKLKINGQEINVGGPLGSAINLKAGEAYQIELSFLNRYNSSHYVNLYWSSLSQERTIVTFEPLPGSVITLPVRAGEYVNLPIQGMTVGDGVKIRLISGSGVAARYPFWDYDGRAVLYD